MTSNAPEDAVIAQQTADEESLISLARHPGWKILAKRMDVFVNEAERVLDECGDASDTYRLHRACSIRRILVTLLKMVREAPVRHAALVSGAAGLSAKPSPESLV
jgi:hypothetical protein